MNRTACLLFSGFVVVLGCRSSAPGGGSTGDRSAPRTGETGGEIRKVGELPAQYRQVLLDYSAGGEVWAARRAAVAADPALARFLVDNLVLETVRAFETATLADPERGSGPYERAQAELARLPEYSVPVLGELLAKRDDLVGFVARDTLVKVGRPAIPVALRQLEHSDWKVRLLAAELLGDLPHAGGDDEEGVRQALVQHLEKDPEWVVRAQVARSLGHRGTRDRVLEPTRKALERGLLDEDLGVAQRAAEALGELGDPAAAPALQRFLERATRAGRTESVRVTAAALKQLAPGR